MTAGTPSDTTPASNEGPQEPPLDEARALADAHGGHWGQHPSHPLADWQYQVSNDDTRLGYWEWVCEQLLHDAEDDPYGLLAELARIEKEHEALLSELEAMVPDARRTWWTDDVYWELIAEVKSELGERAANECSDDEGEQDGALDEVDAWVADAVSPDARGAALLVWLEGAESARAWLAARLSQPE